MIRILMILTVVALMIGACDKEVTEPEEIVTPVAPSNPYPIDGTENLPNGLFLSWEGNDADDGAIQYAIYLGTNVLQLELATAEDIHNDFYYAGNLAESTTYIWQVVAYNDNGDTALSPVWTFTTGPNSAPMIPSNPYPADGATDVSIATFLSWDCDDIDNDSIEYHVLIDEDSIYFNYNYYKIPPSNQNYILGEGYYQSEVSVVLQQIYQGEMEFFNSHGYYWGSGINADSSAASYDNFETIGVLIPREAIYSYGINRATDSILQVRAVANTDFDATCDMWTINENGEMAHLINEFNLSFIPESTYYWKIVAIDSKGNETVGPLWSFTTDDNWELYNSQK